MMNPLYALAIRKNALDYSRYPRGNTASTVLLQMHYCYRGSTVHSVPSPRYYREILPIPTVITAVTAVLLHSPLPCHSLITMLSQLVLWPCESANTLTISATCLISVLIVFISDNVYFLVLGSQIFF